MKNSQYQTLQPITNEYPQPTPQNNILLPFQPVQNPVMDGASAPLLNTNFSQNVSLQAAECFDDLIASSEAFLTKYLQGYYTRDIKYNVSIKYKAGGEDRFIFVGKKKTSLV